MDPETETVQVCTAAVANTAAPLLVSRPRVSALLSSVPASRLVVVSAPAGTGKTTAVAQWAAGLPGEVAWVRATAAGSDSPWEAILGALAAHGVPVDVAHGRPGRERVLGLAARVSCSPTPLTVVLDGFDFLGAPVTAQLELLVRHAAHRLRVVIASRGDPMVPADPRTRGNTVAVGQTQLAFTDPEAVDLLTALGAGLPAPVVAHLNRTLAGWPVGLHLAAAVLAGSGCTPSAAGNAVRRASGINEYVLDEVVNAQAPEVRRFLLRTCVVEELTPQSVEQVAGPRAVQILAGLQRLNVYLEPAAGVPGSHRYPPFFRDMLRSQLSYESRIPQESSHLGHVPAQRAPSSQPQRRAVLQVVGQAGPDEPLLIETLTPRELEVLRHLEDLLTTEEIADSMFVSVNTVRTHIRNVLRKLGVNGRYAAVRRARALGLVARVG